MKFIISLKFVIIFNWYFSQEKTLSLKLDSNLHIVNNYIANSKIDLISLRATSNLLTNNSLLEYNSIILPERKKAFIRHIKHINEKLEEYYFESRDIDSQAIEDYKTWQNNHAGDEASDNNEIPPSHNYVHTEKEQEKYIAFCFKQWGWPTN